MGRDPLDRLFRRFRERGDVSALAEIFDQVAPEMLRVARHVAPRSVEAQDLVQTTFLVAIERADSYDPTRPVKSWLLGILTKEAAYERRKDARAVEPDRLEQREAHEPGESAADHELHEAVNEALDTHELIKVRFNVHKESKKPLTAEIAERTHCEVAGIIGHVAILYREQEEPEKRVIKLGRS